ncbi:hypothetical protein LEM8419_02436 [Neolewinella maritima]|uniref:Type 1 periplasmic binding fold superfamily protein n=2 Tax=Neolewinella maritima TaxID=1383882 RepID=A0ABM9B327_9BACT|nr:hypothetical protein LEM8419_02436 [Neolewinella maritima]
MLFALILFAVSCGDDDDPIIPNEEELITDLIYTLVPNSGTGGTVTFSFQDRDGDGGQPPVIATNGTLVPNTVYLGTVQLLDASDPSDVEDITLEVAEEDEEHQFFYQTATALDVTVDYADADADGNPIGIRTTLTTGASSSGDMTIILRHEPNKTAAGISISNPTPAGGATDVETTFQVAF